MALLVTSLASMVASMASMASMASLASMATMATMVLVASMATMVASMVSSRSKEETTAKGDIDGHKGKCQNGRQCHESKMALMIPLASMVASMASVALVASMASMASMASRALMVAAIMPLEWLNGMVAEFIRLTPRCEESLDRGFGDGFDDD